MSGAEGRQILPVTNAPIRAVRWLTLLGLAVAIGMVALGAGVLWDAREDAWHQATRSAENLTIAMEREIGRTIGVYDLSLQGAVEALSQPGIDDMSPALRHIAIFDRSASAEYLGSLLVLDAQGIIVDDSTAIVPHRLNLGDRDYFTVQRDHPDAGLFVSRPFRSRLRGGDPSISISRRVNDQAGHFAGVVVGTLRLAYFEDMFSRLKLPAGTTVVLERSDGRLVVRYPGSFADLDRDLSGSPLHAAGLAHESGEFLARSVIDGVTRWVIYRNVAGLPLVLSIATSIDTIYASWWHKALGIGAILLILSGATVLLILMFRREMLRRVTAEDALFDAATKLSVMAATDGLTGLGNRRAFEADLQHEWKRAIRTQSSLCLLMLDADFFKAFNDRYGHLEGDDVLRCIAGCIERCIRRPGDAAARFGGEEFVALLPETELAGAMLIAERIIAAVAALGIAHQDSTHGIVTVSVGVAAAYPAQGEPETTLVRAADLALYAAKRSGRARACLAPAPRRDDPSLGLPAAYSSR